MHGVPVYTPDTIGTDYDIIFVASIYSDEIYQTVCESGIPLEKVCFMNLPLCSPVDARTNFELAQQFLDGDNLEMVDTKEGAKAFVLRDLQKYAELNTRPSFQYDARRRFFISADKYTENGGLDYIYFLQDLWGARKIKQAAPEKHYDIGSRVDGFISHLLSFRENVILIDIRPLDFHISGLEYVQADATNLEGIDDNSIESISALHSLEHFGLGRYGDPIDPDACFKAFHAIQRKVRPGGNAYISVPIGEEHVEFNAHRIFYARTIIEAFHEMELVEFSVVDGAGKCIHKNPPLDQYNSYSIGTGFAGLYHFQKPECY